MKKKGVRESISDIIMQMERMRERIDFLGHPLPFDDFVRDADPDIGCCVTCRWYNGSRCICDISPCRGKDVGKTFYCGCWALND